MPSTQASRTRSSPLSEGARIVRDPVGDARHVVFVPTASPQWPRSTYAQGPVAVVFEGHLHDAEVLADAVDHPRGTSPARLIASAYARWDLAMLRFLDGAFALCVHDLGRDVWLAARDRTGMVPLFYAESSHGTVLATSAEAVRRHPDVRGAIDRTEVSAYLLTAGRTSTRSFFEGVARLLPGHALRAHGTLAPTTVPYWAPLEADLPEWLGEADVDRFPELMRNVLRKQTRGRRAGVFLSGGLDSGTVAALGAEALAGREPSLRAYGLVFDHPEENEEAAQRGIAEVLDMPLTLHRLDPKRDAVPTFEASLALNDTLPHPLASSFRSAYVDLGRQARADGCDVILTGDGGDEWLEVHEALAADLWRRLSLSELRTLTDTVREAQGMPALRAGRHVLWQYGLRLLLLDAAERAARRIGAGPWRRRRGRLARTRLPAWLAPDRTIREALVQRLATADGRGPKYRHEVLEETLHHPLTLLYHEESFEVGRRSGVTMTPAFHHPDVVAFLVRLPPHLRSLGGRYKGVLRRLLHDRFPHLGYDHQAKAYANHFARAMVYEGMRQRGRGVTSFPALADLGVIDGDEVRRRVERAVQHPPGGMAVVNLLWSLACAERWVQSRSSV